MSSRQQRTWLVLTLILTALCFGAKPVQAQSGLPKRKVMIVGIDGVRPDALAAANTPQIDAWIANGAYSATAQAGDITLSGPGWSSMLTGVGRDKHGVDDNSFSGSNFIAFPHFFTRIKESCPNLFTASIVHWSPINSEIVSDSDLVTSVSSDPGVSAAAVDLLQSGDPDILFLHFDQVDGTGHGSGFSPANPPYLNAIENVDGHLVEVWNAVTSRPTFSSEDWLVICSTDHGGLGTGHGGNTNAERTIFFLVSGSASAVGTTISPAPEIVDVPATVFDFLGIPVPQDWAWDGNSVGLSGNPPNSELDCVTCARSLQAEVGGAHQSVALTWIAGGPTLDVDQYELRRNGTLIATLPVSSNSYVDSLSLSGRWHQVLEYSLTPVGGPDAPSCDELATRAVVSPGDVRFFDNFDSYSNDGELVAAGWSRIDVANPLEAATWSVENPGGILNPATIDGTPSRGSFVSSNSDFGGSSSLENPTGSGMSYDLWSPSINCTGLTTVGLHADVSAVLNNNGKAVFYVDVTTNNGLNWVTHFLRVAPSRTEAAPFVTIANADGFFGRLDLDISSTAANQPSVRVRFRHFEPSWDWWIAIDNVIVDDLPMRTGGSATLLANESFTAGIPANWSISGLNSGLNTWNTSDPCDRSISANGTAFPYQGGGGLHRLGVNFAILDSDCNPDPAEDEYLITPPIDASGATEVYLHYRSELRIDPSSTEEVLLSLDGGQTFQPALFSYALGAAGIPEDPVYSDRILHVPAAAGESDVRFAFRFSSAGNRYWWAVTDVSVSAELGVQFVRGDVNGDGSVDVSDPVVSLAFLFSQGPLGCESAADTNDDGLLDISDPIFGLAFLFGGGLPIPAPTACGEDPTPDSLTCTGNQLCP